MGLYAISDLHLSLNSYKPMDIFGSQWKQHYISLRENWLKTVKQEDTVLIGGDISWAMTLEEAKVDLDFIHKLPGKKILIRGNHDYWWKGITELNNLYGDMIFLQNSHTNYEGYAICGTRGWICADDDSFSEHDRKIYRREIVRLEISLKSALAKGANKIIVLIHYPPTNSANLTSEFTKLFQQYPVEKVVYGHLHSEHHCDAINGITGGVTYFLTSSDFLEFCPIRIL